MSPHEWEHLGDEELYRYLVFRARRSRRRSPRTGVEIGFFLLDTVDWVNVIPITAAGEIVLVRQFRHGSDGVSLEIPGGIIDRSDRDPAATAARELREETGYVADELVALGEIRPNPAFMTNRCHVFVARGCRLQGALQMDPGEDIEVVTMPLAELDAAIAGGVIDHAIVLAALARWRAAERGGAMGPIGS
ncbi:MAG: NUDIX hydrolase [Planctomycetes bacterium]|nr:NUDIX hydrolase [Planctomycetota bacterium]MCB9884339.1 NUDIX hydrolase [Planctomycetota bacterium]